MTEHMKALIARVKGATNQKTAVEALVNGLADELGNLTQDPVAIKAMAGDLRTACPELAAAVGPDTTPRPVPHAPATAPAPALSKLPNEPESTATRGKHGKP